MIEVNCIIFLRVNILIDHDHLLAMMYVVKYCMFNYHHFSIVSLHYTSILRTVHFQIKSENYKADTDRVFAKISHGSFSFRVFPMSY